MFKKIALVLMFCIGANATNLTITKGEINAHTEVFGDSEINPYTKNVQSSLTIDDKIESIKGQIFFDTLTMVSTKKDRDDHMYKLLNVEKYKTVSFEIISVVKNGLNYDINGVLTLSGVSKNITVKSNIIEENGQILLDGGFSFNLTDFKLEPPTMLFLTVRNQIDITYKIDLKK